MIMFDIRRLKMNKIKKMTLILAAAALMAASSSAVYADVPSGPAADTEVVQKEEVSGPAAEAENTSGASDAVQGGGQENAGLSDNGSGTQGTADNAAGGQTESSQQDSGSQNGLIASGGRYLDPNKPMVALTFDDGPYAPVGNRIMDCAEQYGGRVTFFVVGNRVNAYQAEIKRMHDNGHEIGNHTYEHKYLNRLDAGQIRSQIDGCNQAVAAVTGEVPRLVRLPGGNKNSTVLANITQPIIMWNIDTLDWKTRNAAQTVQTVLSQVKDGDIILMHELYTQSGDAACTLIPALTERGYQLVTVSELARFRGGAADKNVYYSFPR